MPGRRDTSAGRNYSTGNTIGVGASGTIENALTLSGKWDVNYNPTGEDGGIHQEIQKQFVFELIVVEDDWIEN